MNTSPDNNNNSTSSSSTSNKSTSNHDNRKRGNINLKFEKRKKLIQLREDITDEFHLQLDADNGESPLILIELDKKEWKRLKPNSIDVSSGFAHLPANTHINKKKIYYNNIKYGDNLLQNKNNITTKKMEMKDESSFYTHPVDQKQSRMGKGPQT